jgi:hypothetical protein
MINPMQQAREALKHHPCCGAHARTTGKPCKSPAMSNGRCRMHGGKSTGRPIIHGRCTKAVKRQRQEVREILRGLKMRISDADGS